MKAREIYKNMTPGEHSAYITARKVQGTKIADAMWPIMPLAILFAFLGRYDIYATLLFLALCGLCLVRLPFIVRDLRQENRELLSKTAFARERNVLPDQIRI